MRTTVNASIQRFRKNGVATTWQNGRAFFQAGKGIQNQKLSGRVEQGLMIMRRAYPRAPLFFSSEVCQTARLFPYFELRSGLVNCISQV